MKTRHLGTSDLVVSEVGLGCNNFGMLIDLDASRKVIDRAIDLGITLFDTADIYGNRGGSETILGKVLNSRRKNIVLATKVGKPMDAGGTMKGASRSYIFSGVEASLKRLQTDWIDLYQIHEPDPLTPIEETLRALDDLVRQGKVRYLGCSNFPAQKVAEACRVSGALKISRFISCQDQYNLLVRAAEQELMPAMENHGLGLLPFFPLAGGMLTGKYTRGKTPAEGTRFAMWKDLARRYDTEANWNAMERLERFCADRNYSMLEVAFGWLLSNPVVSSVIAGATKPEQVDMNARAAGRGLSPEDIAAMGTLLKADG
jgi:aryl-alcohol dehydrogenase-like predicted oxidoreductase